MNTKRVFLVFICIIYLFSVAGCQQIKTPDVTTTPTPTPEETITATPSAKPTDEPAVDILTPDNPVWNFKYPSEPIFRNEQDRNYQEVPFKPAVFEKKVAPYKVASDLSNIENLDQFGEFNKTQRDMLAQNAFLVTQSSQLQLYHVYERNEYLKIPSFITVDSVLQVYHIFFDYSLRTLEAEMLLKDLEQLTDSMLKKSVAIYNGTKTADVKEIALNNIAYFLVAHKALEMPALKGIPQESQNIATSEFQKVSMAAGFEESEIAGCDVDYSQFTVRGHYTRNHDFERYFKAMMWYGFVPFSLFDQDEKRNEEATAKALLMAYSMFLPVDREKQDIDLWESIYDPTAFYVGKADDLTVYDYKDLLIAAYGENPDIEKLMQKDKMDIVYKEAEKLRAPDIQSALTTVNSPAGKQFRFMGQRYIPDSEILQRLVKSPERVMPSGLDVMAVLGSEKAYHTLINQNKVTDVWPGYPEKFSEVKTKFDSLPQSTWQSNMYYGWLWVVKPLLGSYGTGYPSFMNNSAWQYKSLNTALASWAELRHDTVLYGKQSAAECGGDWPPPEIKSYVEPNIEAYERLLWLTAYSRENLSRKGILPQQLDYQLTKFQELLNFLIQCSIKELRNEELTTDEYDTLLIYGGNLEWLTLSMAEGPVLSETDKNMAVIADVHTTPGKYLEAGVGPASEIFVVVPIGGKLYLTRGAVFSYYEFTSGKRLTDEEWQGLFNNGKEPEQPEWTKIYRQGKKDEIPEPAEPFNSGC